jgi:hypothetical protein
VQGILFVKVAGCKIKYYKFSDDIRDMTGNNHTYNKGYQNK